MTEVTVPALPATGPRFGVRLNAAFARRMLGLVLLVAAWELFARLSDNRLAPTTLNIIDQLSDLISSGDLWFHGRLTLMRAFMGLALAIVFGVTIGMAMARSRWVEAALEPMLSGLYSIPKISLYPVMIAAFGLGGTAKVWQVALECTFPILFNTFAGARAVDKNYLWFARNVGVGRMRVLKDILFPTALPSILTGIRIATPIMLIVITVTELIGESRGLGFLISDSQANFRPDRAMAVVVVLGVLGFVLDRINVWLGRTLVFWEKGVKL